MIALSRNRVAFAMEGGTTAVSVATPSPWEASCPDGWVTLTPADGLLTISAAGNLSDGVREATITVRTASDEREITVHQAYTSDKVLLSTTASDEISFDSEGETFFFSVVTNGKWDASCDAEWVNVASDPATNTVRIEAPRNPEAHRTAKIVIRSVKGDVSEQCEVAVSQISRDENPYYRMLGYYGLHAENWFFGRDPIGVSGTGTFCTIEEKEYRKTFNIKNLFLNDAVVEAKYDRNTQTLSIELGRVCYIREISSTVSRLHYLYGIDMESGKFHSGTLTGKLGEGYNDMEERTRKAILLSGFDAPYTTLGVIGYQSQQWMSFGDLFYASGPMYLVECDTPADPASASTSVTRAAEAIAPSEEGFPVFEQ